MLGFRVLSLVKLLRMYLHDLAMAAAALVESDPRLFVFPVAANKVPGIRAGLCHDTYSAHQGVEHDNMNVLVLGSRIIGLKLAEDLVKSFLGAQFTHEERHNRRLAKIAAMEQKFGH